MALSAITADSLEGRILLALRAGEMDSSSCQERFKCFSQAAVDLVRAGLIERGDESYRITEAGRAACPFRNPLAAAMPATSQPKENTMPLTRIAVLDAIIAAGPAGITRKALSEKFGVSDNIIDNHVWHLCSAEEPEVARPRRGVLVASRFSGEATAAAPAQPVARASVTSGYNPADVPVFAEQRAAEATRDRVARRLRTLPDYIDIDEPDLVELCIFSSGGMDIYFEDNTITLSAPVLAKLRAFLGLFQEAA